MITLSRASKLIALALAVVLSLSLALMLLVLTTERGSNWLVQTALERLNDSGDIELGVQNIQGRLWSDLSLTGVEISSAAADIEIAQLDISWEPLTFFSPQLQVRRAQAYQVHLQLKDNPDALETAADSVLQLPALAIAALSVSDFTSNAMAENVISEFDASVTLADQSVSFSQFSLMSALLQAEGALQLEFNPEVNVSGQFDWRTEAGIVDGAPALAGTLALAGSMSELQLDHELRTPLQISTSGSVLQAGDLAQLEIALEHVVDSLDLSDYYPGLSLAGFSATTSGPLERLEIGALGEIVLTDQLEFSARLEAVADPENFRVELLELISEDSRFESEFNLQLAQELSLEGSYQATNIALHELAPFFGEAAFAELALQPLYADASGSIQLSQIPQTQGGLNIYSQFDAIRIPLGDEEVLGSGSIQLQPELVSIPGFTLASQSARLDLQGEIGAESSLRWQISLDDISQFVATMQGSVAGEGELLGTLEQPFATGNLSFNELQTPALQLQSAIMEIGGTPSDFSATVLLSDLELELPGISERFDSALLTIGEQDGAGKLGLTAQSDLGLILVDLQGSTFLAQPFAWDGELIDLQMQTLGYQWQLQSPVALRFDEQAIALAETCLQAAATSFCVSARNARETAQTSFNLALENLPIAALTDMQRLLPLQSLAALQPPALPRGVSLEGTVSLLASGGSDAAAQLQLDTSVAIAELVMAIAADADLADQRPDDSLEQRIRRFHWQDIAATANLQEQVWDIGAEGELDFQEFEGERLEQDGMFSIALTIDAETRLAGGSTIRFDDLGWLEAYTPDISSVSGRLNSQFGISGSLDQPRLEGFFALENSGFNLDTWGVRIDNFRGMATTTAEGEVSIAASAQTDNGQLAITGIGSGLLQDDLDLSLQLTGDDFQLLSSPDASARVTPDLSLIADSEGISLRGTIQVPHLFIAMGALPDTAIDVSSDVVIVNYPADQPELARSLAAVDNRFMSVPISANLALELGEDVRFTGMGLDTRLQGTLTVEQLANGSNRTFGELAVIEGSYSLYGQTLQLEEGELLFIGPYDNPGLDIRATRDVGDTEVGLQMNGTLRNIQSELFSTPSLPENDIIALLVTGRPFNEIGQSDEDALLGSVARLGLARGRVISERVRNSLGLDTLAITNTGSINETLLTVGKYITPSIFVRYGLGLFDNQSKISVDYDLTQSIKLQAESGENQSLDVTYSIEN